MTCEILLPNGGVALVDDADAALVTPYRWRRVLRGKGREYAASLARGRPAIAMHRLILGAAVGAIIDHVNGDGLDNRRSNLRFCTSTENAQNRRTPRSNTSGFKGVSFSERRGLWIASIVADGKAHRTTRKTAELAARWYDQKARELHGEFACLNFPGDLGSDGSVRMGGKSRGELGDGSHQDTDGAVK